MHLPLALLIICQIFLKTVTNQVREDEMGDSIMQSFVNKYKRINALLNRLE